MTEFELIARLAPYLSGPGPGIVVGAGDDAAVLDVDGHGLVVTVDVLVEDVHFRRDLSRPGDIGWKAVAVNASDVAAMGARPRAAVVGLSRPGDLDPGEVEALYAGMAEACTRWGVALLGGDTVAASSLSVAVTALGLADPDRVVLRSGARPGDRLVVAGALGAAGAALAALRAGRDPGPDLLAAHRRPTALVEAGSQLAHAGATAMIDVSDGLGADLGHLCTASGVGARVRWSDLPAAGGVVALAGSLGADPVAMVCGGGEDFALLAAVPAERADEAVAAAAAADGVPAAVVGEVVEAEAGSRLELPGGRLVDLAGMGYDHYRKGNR